MAAPTAMIRTGRCTDPENSMGSFNYLKFCLTASQTYCGASSAEAPVDVPGTWLSPGSLQGGYRQCLPCLEQSNLW